MPSRDTRPDVLRPAPQEGTGMHTEPRAVFNYGAGKSVSGRWVQSSFRHSSVTNIFVSMVEAFSGSDVESSTVAQFSSLPKLLNLDRHGTCQGQTQFQ